MIFTGYVLIFTYIFFLILGVGSFVKKVTNVEISRKVIHTGLFMVWIMIDVFLKNTIHQIIIPMIFIIINYLSYKFKIFKNMEREDRNEPGTVYFSISITVLMLIAYIFPETFYSTGIATFCLTFGDGFAAIIGGSTKSRLIRGNKSLNGFISCFAFSTIATYIFGICYNLPLSILMCIVIGLGTAIFELVGKGLDNFSVVIISFLLSLMFLNYNLTNLTEIIFLAEIFFVIIFLAKGLDYKGALLAIIMFISYMYFGGIFGIAMLLGEYLFIFLISKIKKIFFLKNKEKEKPRTFLQVLINGGIGTLFVVLYGLFNEKVYLIISIVSLSGCFVDSVASDVGTLSKKKPYDIIKRKIVPTGISGGISVLGTVSSLICSVVIALITVYILKLPVYYIYTISGLIFFQIILDSVLGSALQAKYECVECHKLTEELEHCNKQTKLVEGVYWMNNNMVNFISSIITTLIAFSIMR